MGQAFGSLPYLIFIIPLITGHPGQPKVPMVGHMVFGVSGRDSSFIFVSRSGSINLSTNNGISFSVVDFILGNDYLAVGTSSEGNTVWAVGLNGKTRWKLFNSI